jgi:hypothetical protein
MEEKLDQLFQVDSVEEWLLTLSKYQQNRVRQLLDSNDSYEEAARQWLDAIPENTFPFGVAKSRNIFFEKIKDEIEKFLCGDEKYADERKNLLSSSEVARTTFVTTVSVAIAPKLGTAANYLIPLVVLAFMTMGKITLNSWCQMLKDSKTVP